MRAPLVLVAVGFALLVSSLPLWLIAGPGCALVAAMLGELAFMAFWWIVVRDLSLATRASFVILCALVSVTLFRSLALGASPSQPAGIHADNIVMLAIVAVAGMFVFALGADMRRRQRP